MDFKLMSPGRAARLCLLLTLCPAGAEAQSDTSPWRAAMILELHAFDSDAPQWSDWISTTVALDRRFPGGVLGVEALRSRRFDRWDTGAAAQAYVDVWDGAYAHVRAQVVPDANVLPSSDLRAEIFQALPQAFEVSASARRLAVPAGDIHAFGLGAAKYLPGWYLRVRGEVTRVLSDDAFAAQAAARRWFDEERGFVELSAGGGREVAEVAAGPAVDIRDSRAAGVRAEWLGSQRFGLGGGVSYAKLEGLPTRIGGTLSLIVRW